MFAQGRPSLYYSDLIKKVSEESILAFYTGITEIPSVTQSPLREDTNPSFSVFYSDSGRVHFKDFATGASYNLIGFLMELSQLRVHTECMNMIVADLEGIKAKGRSLIKADLSNLYSQSDKKDNKNSHNIKVRVRDWKNYDLEYWESYGINKTWLDFGKVYPISNIFLSDQHFYSDKYSYCYVEYKDNTPTFKVYQPYSDRIKWLSSHSSSVWDLWTQALRTDSESLIITSSRKDALTIWANLGIPAVSLQSENTMPKEHVVQRLKDRFKTIWCLYDNDYDKESTNPGREFAKQLSDKYNFTQIEIPAEYKSKDPSDLYKKHGKQEFIKVINNLINK